MARRVEALVPKLRISALLDVAADPQGEYVLYWMTMFRRRSSNFALQRAVEWACQLERPLLILEALRCGYPYASDRLHTFVLEGMACNARAFSDSGAYYYPYLEPRTDAGKGLLATLAARACVVVGDDFPSFMLPHMRAAACAQLRKRFEVVDANGLLPMRAAPREFVRAFDFRRFLQRELPAHLRELPRADPLAQCRLPALGELPAQIRARWPAAQPAQLEPTAQSLRELPIDHSIGRAMLRGGADAAQARLARFLSEDLDHYPERRDDPAADATSRLSPYLHFGHIGTHEVLARLARRERWSLQDHASVANGAREGWWRMSAAAEALLDQLVTWRELGYNACVHRPDTYQHFEALPEWAQRTLREHERDPRPHLYSLRELDAGRTHDPVWNAAHAQLVREGWFHNRLRMLWGKKILEWSAHPRDALRAMRVLMDKYSLDGRNPNSYAGYLWTLGKYDRPWAPERPIFGTVRYMSSESALRRPGVRRFTERFAPEASGDLFDPAS